jgi:hypothetical protein
MAPGMAERPRGSCGSPIPGPQLEGNIKKPVEHLTGFTLNMHAMMDVSFHERHLAHLYFSIVFQAREVDARCKAGCVELHLIEYPRLRLTIE